MHRRALPQPRVNPIRFASTSIPVAKVGYPGATEHYADGFQALFNNTTGNDNTASGALALVFNTTGSSNIGLGYLAGSNIKAGKKNIEIGGAGTSDESNTIRIGTQGTQKKPLSLASSAKR